MFCALAPGTMSPRVQLAAAKRAHGLRCELTHKSCSALVDPQVVRDGLILGLG